tara:strand:- start:474 stop:659 length:186 start_codon:yes stop_codon:yes gene_type:complete
MKTLTVKNNPAQAARAKRLAELEAELVQMQTQQVKFQRQQGLKEDIYRLRREIAEQSNKLN